MRNILFALLVLGVAFCSCTKEESFEGGPASPVPTPGDTTATAPATDTYQPLSAGSSWEYEVHEKISFDSTLFEGMNLEAYGLTIGDLMDLMGISSQMDTTYRYTITSLGRDTVIGGKTYAVVYQDLNQTNGYMRTEEGDYFMLGDLYGTGPDGADFTSALDLLYLKDDQPVGTTWEEQESIAGYVNIYTYKIVAKGIEKEVNGVTYKNVIQVEMVNTLPDSPTGGMPDIPGLSGLTDNKNVFEYYYAAGIGFIASEMEAGFGTEMTVGLVSADIK